MESENQTKNLTVLGRQMQLNGVLEFTDNLVITGKFTGTINSTGNLEIASSAIVDADKVSCSSLVISGKIVAPIVADQKIEMLKGAVVRGDIKTKALRIEENVDFEGSVTMLDAPPDIDLFSLSGDEFKDCLAIKAKEAH